MASRRTPNLTNYSAIGRNVIKYGAVLLVVMIVGRFLLTTGLAIYRAMNPPPPTPPTMGFGLIAPPNFPSQLPADRPTTITLETVGQKLPAFKTKADVYFMPSSQPNLLALDKAKQHAASLGFVFDPEKISTSEYRWRISQPLPSLLEINVVYNLYDMKVDWASSVDLLNQKFIPEQSQANSDVRTLIRQLDLLQPDLATASAQLTYLKALAGETKPAASISDADFTQADVYRNVPNGMPSITSKYGQGVIRVLFSGSREQGARILAFHSDYVPLDASRVETYPLITATQAWQSIQNGQGYVTNKGGKDPAVVRSVYLAYFEPPKPQNYYQPVYVFEGDEGFQILVSALSPGVFQTMPISN